MPKHDPTAPKKKRALKSFTEKWNKKNPGHRIVRPEHVNLEAEIIGTPAREWVRNMQTAVRLPVTGKFDKATMLKLLPPNIRGKVMAEAHSQLGEHEWPPYSNRGEIVKYLNAAGLGGGSPWCAAFITWVLKREGFRHIPAYPAGVESWLNDARNHGLTKPIAKSLPGDLWIWGFGGNPHAHIGFCDDAKPGDYNAYGLDGNVGGYGGMVTHVTRSSGLITASIDLVKLHNLK